MMVAVQHMGRGCWPPNHALPIGAFVPTGCSKENYNFGHAHHAEHLFQWFEILHLKLE
jgi:hypothetical protein